MSQTYRIMYLPSVRKSLRKLPDTIRKKILKAIDRLAADPRPRGVEPLEGKWFRYYRLRVGRDYRVLYRILDDRLIVIIIRVSHRKDVYRGSAPDMTGLF